MKLFKRLSIASLGGTTLSNGATVLLGVGAGVTLARSLGPAGRGELAAALLWPWVLSLFAEMGLGYAFCFFSAKYESRFDDLWTTALACGFGLGGIAILAGVVILPWVGRGWSPQEREAMRIALGSIPFVLLVGNLSYLFLGRQRVFDYNVLRFLASLCYLLITVGIAALGHAGVKAFATGYVASQACGFVIAVYMIRRRFRPRFRLTTDLLKPLFTYALKGQLSSLSAQANLRLDQTVMSFLFSSRQLGQYVVAVAISGFLTPLFSALSIVLWPKVTHTSDPATGALLSIRFVKVAVVISLPVIVIAFLGMPLILPMFFGPGYGEAVLPARILVGASMFQGLNALLGNSLRGIGQPAKPAWAEGVGMVVTCILLWFLLPLWGVPGAAVASFGAYGTVTLMELLFLVRAAGLDLRSLVRSPNLAAVRIPEAADLTK